MDINTKKTYPLWLVLIWIILGSGVVQVGANFVIEYLKIRQQVSRDDQKVKQQKLQAEEAIIKNHKIYEILNTLDDELPLASYIIIYSLHNHGGVPTTGERLNLTVLYAQRDKGISNIKNDWQNRELYEGYAWLHAQVLQYGSYYVEDVRIYESIYQKETAEYLDYNNTQSLYSIHLKTGTDATYYLSAAFDIKHPHEIDPQMKVKLENAASRLRPLLEVNNRPVRD